MQFLAVTVVRVKMELLERFAISLQSQDTAVFQDVNAYIKWEADHGKDNFKPETSDDVAIRAYLLDRHIQGADHTALSRITSSLEFFHTWLKANDLVAENPFETLNGHFSNKEIFGSNTMPSQARPRKVRFHVYAPSTAWPSQPIRHPTCNPCSTECWKPCWG
jgi:hypothetical protein